MSFYLSFLFIKMYNNGIHNIYELRLRLTSKHIHITQYFCRSRRKNIVRFFFFIIYFCEHTATHYNHIMFEKYFMSKFVT